MFPISQKVGFTRLVAQFDQLQISYVRFRLLFSLQLVFVISVFLPESVLVAVFRDCAASSSSAEADVLDRVVEVVLEDEVFLHVDLHEGVAADNNWRSDGAEDSGPVICAAAEESAVVLNYFCQIKNLIRKVIIFFL